MNFSGVVFFAVDVILFMEFEIRLNYSVATEFIRFVNRSHKKLSSNAIDSMEMGMVMR